MNILPIRLISDIEQPLFGTDLYNLAQLSRAGFPVAPGIAISPPQILFDVTFKHITTNTKEIFETKYEILKKEMLNISIPLDLEKELSGHKQFFVGESFVKSKKDVWNKLLALWLSEMRTKIWNESAAIIQKGSKDAPFFTLSALTVFFVDKVHLVLNAYFDLQKEETVISGSERLSPKILHAIDTLVISANKKLMIPQVYTLALTKSGIFITKIHPFTPSDKKVASEAILTISKEDKKNVTKSAVKVYLSTISGFVPSEAIDGILFEGEKLMNIDQTISALEQAAHIYSQKKILYKLPDIIDSDIRGALRLVSQKSLLEGAVKIFLFLKNKKNILNLELVLPYLRSPEELILIKRELASYGISRKGTLRMWMEAAVPENIITIEEYLKIGIDGILLNLDEIQQLLLGYRFHESSLYKKQEKALLAFLQHFFKKCHTYKIPILAKGDLCLNSEVLQFLIESGVWGIVANTSIEAESLPSYLTQEEFRVIQKKFA